jgi:hypothetical protein
MFVCCECCVLSGRGLCDGLITRPEESYRLWRVVVCDQEIQPQWVVTPGKQTNKRIWSIGGTILTGESKILGKKPVPVTLCLSKALYGLAWHWAQASALANRTLNAWGMACIACRYVSKVSQWCWFRSESHQIEVYIGMAFYGRTIVTPRKWVSR